MITIDSLCVDIVEGHLTDINCTVDSLKSQLDLLQTKSDVLLHIVETSNDSVANQLSSASVFLTVISIIFAIGGVLLGIYFNKKKKEIDAIAKTVEESRQRVDEISATTVALDKQIHSSIKDLYQQLRIEETNTLLDRLILEPNDIGNLIHLLLARDLDDAGFNKLREAYLKLLCEPDPDEQLPQDGRYIKLRPTHLEDYSLLFFQHYCYQAIKDDKIRPELVKGFENNCKKAFKRDIIKTTIDLCKALSEETSSFNKNVVLLAYIKALNNSKHKDLPDLKNILEQNITPKSLLQDVLEQCKNDGIEISLFKE